MRTQIDIADHEVLQAVREYIQKTKPELFQDSNAAITFIESPYSLDGEKMVCKATFTPKRPTRGGSGDKD
jgi:hypothetical protein